MPGENVKELEGQVTNLEAQVDTLTKQLEAIKKSAGSPEASIAELTTQLNAMTDNLEKASAALEVAAEETAIAKAKEAEAIAISKMTDAQKEYFGAGAGAKDEDSEEEKEKKKKSFIEMKEEEREEEVKKFRASDESVVLEGQVIHKRAVGAPTFTILKAQAARIEKSEKNLAIEKAARETAVFEKRADDKYSHVPGSTQERAAMLSAIEKMDEPLKKSFTAVLEQSEKLAKAGFDRVGSGGNSDPKNEAIQKAARTFEGKVSEIKKRDSLSSTAAFSKARKEHPDLYKAYQGEEAAEA